MDIAIHVIYFSTFFMFTTVQSFAIAGAKFVQVQIESYSENYAKKFIDSDKKKIDILLEQRLSDAIVQNYDGLKEQKDLLSRYLTKIGERLPLKVTNSFNKILLKVRFFTFVFGVHSAIMIFYIALVENKLLSSNDMMSYMCLTSLYFLILPLMYKKFPRNTIKKYVTAASIIFLIFFLVIFEVENFTVSLLLISIISLFVFKEEKQNVKFRETIFLILVYSFFLNLISSNFIEYSLREFFLRTYEIININNFYHNIISISLFAIVYLVVTLVMPIVCFYTRGETIFKQYNKHRDRLINKFDSLKEIEERIAKIEENRNSGEMYLEIKKIRENIFFSKNKRDELIAIILKRNNILNI